MVLGAAVLVFVFLVLGCALLGLVRLWVSWSVRPVGMVSRRVVSPPIPLRILVPNLLSSVRCVCVRNTKTNRYHKDDSGIRHIPSNGHGAWRRGSLRERGTPVWGRPGRNRISCQQRTVRVGPPPGWRTNHNSGQTGRADCQKGGRSGSPGQSGSEKPIPLRAARPTVFSVVGSRA